MNTDSAPDSNRAVLAAIDIVLSTERGSAAALERSRQAATASVAVAAERAAHIAARARARIATLHERCGRALQAAMQQIEQTDAGAPDAAHGGDALTHRLAEHVARRLLSHDHDVLGR